MSFKDVLSTLKRVFTDQEPDTSDYIDSDILYLGNYTNIEKIEKEAKKRREQAVDFAEENNDKPKRNFVEQTNLSRTSKRATNTVKKVKEIKEVKEENERE